MKKKRDLQNFEYKLFISKVLVNSFSIMPKLLFAGTTTTCFIKKYI